MAAAEPQEQAKGFSPFVCACFTLNYIIGTGFLALPWAFERAGILLSGVCMVLVCLVANTASDYILTAMARCEALETKLQFEAPVARPDEYTSLLHNHIKEGSEEQERKNNIIIQDTSSEGEQVANATQTTESDAVCYHTTNEGRLLLGERKFDLPEMCQLYLGDKGLITYGVAVTLDIYGFLWAYASVFASAMAKALPFFAEDPEHYRDSYPVYIFVFACLVVPLSLMELHEQASLQVLLSACRIAMMLCMALTPLAATYVGFTTRTNEIDQEPIPHFGDQLGPRGGDYTSDGMWFNVSNIHEMIPIIVFCILFHQAVPGLATEVKDKSKLHTIFGLTFVLCGLCYSLIGVINSFYFGSDILESANLNWKEYHGGTGRVLGVITPASLGTGSAQEHKQAREHQWVDVAIWAKVVSFFVVVFPALDVISVYPLNAFVLGNNFMDITYKMRSNSGAVQTPGHKRRIQKFFRAIAAIPPIVGALFVRNLGTITDYSGLSGLSIAFCIPPLLYIASERLTKERGVPYLTQYERFGSSVFFAKGMLMFGVASIIYCFSLLVLRG